MDAGDDEKQAPKNDMQNIHKADLEVVKKFSKSIEESFDFDATVTSYKVKVHSTQTNHDGTDKNIEQEHVNQDKNSFNNYFKYI